ncbi:MAG: hypothetical protein KIT09_17405 [Bryobacteraceae bacterium]|nr:hypothetical protein [Bryobacteraceae bacterium]
MAPPFRSHGSGPSELAVFVGEVIDAITPCFTEAGAVEPGRGLIHETTDLYVASHYTLAQLLIFLLDGRASERLELADLRLRQWERRGYPARFFNALAIYLAQILSRRSGIERTGLQETLGRLCAASRPFHAEALDHPSGNNMYFMQLVNDFVLLPVATGGGMSESRLAFLFAELDRYRSADGFYYDEPRFAATGAIRRFPLAYCMKFLFLLAVCHALTEDERFKCRFADGMRAALPLMSRDGNFSYFGRSDNTTFASGLTLFCLRAAAAQDGELRADCVEYARRLTAVYRSTPRTPEGYLQTNRFGGSNKQEQAWSRDVYALPSTYSVASAAYVLLAEVLYQDADMNSDAPVKSSIGSRSALSRDLGIAKLSHSEAELFIRTGSQQEIGDRRYFGPTVLRFQVGEKLAVGAIPRRCSRDAVVRPTSWNRLFRVAQKISRRYALGNDELDPRYTGFIPVVIDGAYVLTPTWPSDCFMSDTWVKTEHGMQRVRLRGVVAALLQLFRPGAAHDKRRLPDSDPFPHDKRFKLLRRVEVFEDSFEIEDTLGGPLTGKRIELCVRSATESAASVSVEGLRRTGTLRAWSSDGPARLDVYAAQPDRNEVSYKIVVTGN